MIKKNCKWHWQEGECTDECQVNLKKILEDKKRKLKEGWDLNYNISLYEDWVGPGGCKGCKDYELLKEGEKKRDRHEELEKEKVDMTNYNSEKEKEKILKKLKTEIRKDDKNYKRSK